jgi:hypothetical protein
MLRDKLDKSIQLSVSNERNISKLSGGLVYPSDILWLKRVIHGEDYDTFLPRHTQVAEILLTADMQCALWILIVLSAANLGEALPICFCIHLGICARKRTITGRVIIRTSIEPHLFLSNGVDDLYILIVFDQFGRVLSDDKEVWVR